MLFRSKVFASTLMKHAEKDSKIVGITAAMPSGTGMDLFGKKFPSRMFDVGIAEQHAVTFAAGLATEGYKPYAAAYGDRGGGCKYCPFSIQSFVFWNYGSDYPSGCRHLLRAYFESTI